MSTNTRKRPKPEYGKRLEARRKQLRKTLMSIENETDGELYKQLWYRVENGYKLPETLTVDEVALFSRVLVWTPQQFKEATGIDQSDTVISPSAARLELTTGTPTLTLTNYSPEVENLTSPFLPGIELVKLPLLGNVSAGLSGNGDAVSYIDLKDVPIEALEGSKPENCFLLQVDGDSMACEDVKKDIPPGALVIIDRTLEPDPGDIIVCELERDGERIGILKVFRPKGDFALLESYNEGHKPIIIDADSNATFRGTYVNHFGPGRQARRKQPYR